MKVYYNSKLAKLLTFMEGYSTMMFFGVIITEKNVLSDKTLKHEETHVKQYVDCLGLGLFSGIVLMVIFLALGIHDCWAITLLLAIPILLYYVTYGTEYLYWRIRGFNKTDAYKNIGFERQARWIADTWNLPYSQQHHYSLFGWWRNMT